MTKTVDSWFEGLEPQQRAIANALKALIEQTGPALSCKLAWGFPCWSGNERIFSIAAYKDRCNLQLFYGAQLTNTSPDRIEGTGKALRHVKVRSVEEVDKTVALIISEAIRLDTTNPQRVR